VPNTMLLNRSGATALRIVTRSGHAGTVGTQPLSVQRHNIAQSSA